MMSVRRLIGTIIVLFFLGSKIYPINVLADSPKNQVLLLHSYHAGYKWTDDITSAVSKILGRNSGVDLFVEYLDSKRHYSLEYFDFNRDFIAGKYLKSSFVAVLVSDDYALSFLLKNREKLFKDVPVVFCGINTLESKMIKGQSGITGVVEDVDISRTIELMLQVHPDTKKIVVLNDDTEAGRSVSTQVWQISNKFEGVELSTPHIFSINQLELMLTSLQKNDLVLLGTFSRDLTGQHIEYDDITTMVAQSSAVPVYGLWDFSLGYGIVGGYLASGTFQGEQAAMMVKQIIKGKAITDIPIIIDSPNQYFIDFQVAEKFGLDSDLFPPQTIYINRPPDFYSEHKIVIWSAIFIVSVLSLLSISLAMAVLRKKWAEAALIRLTEELEDRVEERTQDLSVANDKIRDRESQMQRLLSNLHGMAYRCRNDESWTMLYVSDGATKLTGYSPEELIGSSDVTYESLIHPRDRKTVAEAVELGIRGKSHFTTEYRIVTRERKVKWVWEQGQASYNINGEVLHLDGYITDISERKTSEFEQAKLAAAVHQTDDLVLITDLEGVLEYVNPAFENITGYSVEEVLGKTTRILKSGEQPPEFYEQMWATILEGRVWRGRLVNKTKGDDFYTAEVTISPIRDQFGEITHFVGVQRDISHQIILERNLRQAQKLEAMGTLAGGIAHEINTPAQFIGSNLDFILESHPDISKYMRHCKKLAEKGKELELPGAEELIRFYSEHDIDYLLEEIPLALEQSQTGIQQVSKIVQSMKQFAHPGEDIKKDIDINESIQNTVTVCRNEWKYVAEIEFDLDPQLPLVPCHQSELNQVFLNLIVNAAQAIAEVKGDKSNVPIGKIKISTSIKQSHVYIIIADDGPGIPQEILDRIFDPFFTTKAPGKGTGQGLSIAHSLITEKHGGQFYCSSEVGDGAVFTIILPLAEQVDH